MFYLYLNLYIGKVSRYISSFFMLILLFNVEEDILVWYNIHVSKEKESRNDLYEKKDKGRRKKGHIWSFRTL